MSKKKTVYIKTIYPSYHVSLETSREFQEAILTDNNTDASILINKKYFQKLLVFIYKVLRKLKSESIIYSEYFNIFRKVSQSSIMIQMGVSTELAIPLALCKGNKYLYYFDAWESTHAEILSIAQKHKITGMFLSSRTAAQMLSTAGLKCRFIWIPEGICLKKYRYCNYDEKDIDVLELGRRFSKYHEKISPYLQKTAKTHLYESSPGEIIFPDQPSFYNGLARTKISICFPSNITHPHRAGCIETMTVRYLQSIASKCILLGQVPQEMIDLFGYNPVVEADMNKPSEQILSILENYISYIPLIEKNYDNLKYHTWNNRWADMTSQMNASY